MMEAVILAGGLGTRLRSVVKDVPKPMADINGRPFLSYLMDFLSGSGVDNVILSAGYMHEAITGYFGSRYKGIGIVYAIEKEPLGTGGGLRQALKYAEDEDPVILNGDTFFNVDLKKLRQFHVERNGILTLSLKPVRDTGRFGAAMLDGDRITGFGERHFKDFGYINGGIYCVNKKIRGYLDQYGDDEKFSFEKDIMERNAASIEPLGFVSDGYFIDIGIPEDYAKAGEYLRDL